MGAARVPLPGIGYRRFLGLVATGTLFLAVASFVAFGEPELDARLRGSLLGNREHEAAVLTAVLLDFAGHEGLALGVLALMVLRRYRRAALVGPALLAAMVFELVIQDLVRRPGPAQPLAVVEGIRPEVWSFPSGPSTLGVAVGLAVIHRARGWRILFGWILAAGVPLSRLYLGTDHPSDVVAGAGFGMLVAAVVLREPFVPWLADGTAVDPSPVLRHWPEIFLFAFGAWLVRSHEAPGRLELVVRLLGVLLMVVAPFLVAWNLHIARTPPRGELPGPDVRERLRALNVVLFVLGCLWTAWSFTSVMVAW